MLMLFESRAESLILEYVVECRLPIQYLLRPDIGEFLNRPSHAMKQGGLKELLESLVARKMISFHRTSGRVLRASSEVIAEALAPTGQFRKVTYGLTSKGGAYWESAASADWSRYVSCTLAEARRSKGLPEGSIKNVTILTKDKQVATNYLEGLQLLGYSPLKDSMTWKVKEPLRVTYWKSLARGFRLDCRCYLNGEGGAKSWTRLPANLRALFEPAGWYKRP
jgi:hypothetical protein